jgi:dipeptidyl aminopeptidase/acylaminoacyl peptidase/thioredoxin-related protein
MSRVLSSFVCLVLFVCITGNAFSQGIRFQRFLNWEVAKQKAKEENKFIFLDLYTTWCGPCKQMENQVYVNNAVGNYFNAHFLSIKVQMDQTKSDDDGVKNWYPDVKAIETKYKIAAYPTFLFFSPSGALVGNEVGFKNPMEFLAIADSAIGRERIYYRLLENYRKGIREYDQLPYMLTRAEKLSGKELADSLSNDYFDYLSRESESHLFTKVRLSFIAANLKGSQSKFFSLFYVDGDKVDAIMKKKGYARKVVDGIIKAEDVIPALKGFYQQNTIAGIQAGAAPNWDSIGREISNKYNKWYGERIIRSEMAEFYYRTGNRADYIHLSLIQYRKHELDTTESDVDARLNELAWFIFLGSRDSVRLDTAIEIIRGVLKRNNSFKGHFIFLPMDTYANLLYKNCILNHVGQVRNAIWWEEKALAQASLVDMSEREADVGSIQSILNKMRKAEPTWQDDAASVSKPRNVKEEKPVIDSAAIYQWVNVGYDDQVSISNNGEYLTYGLVNEMTGANTLVVRSKDGAWKQTFSGALRISFSADSKQFVFKQNDTLRVLCLGTGVVRSIPGLAGYKMPTIYGQPEKGEWLAYQLNDQDRKLILYNLVTGKDTSFSAVTDYSFDQEGRALLLQTSQAQGPTGNVGLIWVDLLNNRAEEIYSGDSVTFNSLDIYRDGTQLAFVVKKIEGTYPRYSLWYYKAGTAKAVLKASDEGTATEPPIWSAANFSQDGRFIYLREQRPDLREPNPKIAKLNVWNYKDFALQSLQIRNPDRFERYTDVIDVSSTGEKNSKIVRLAGEDEQVISDIDKNGDYTVVHRDAVFNDNPRGDRFWLSLRLDSNWLVSLKDGSRRFLTVGAFVDWKCSPNGRYLVYYDAEEGGQYFSYEMATGKKINISGPLPAGYFAFVSEYQKGKIKPWMFGIANGPVGTAGWLNEDEGILVYDNFDIWLLSLNGERPPVNITNAYGRKHQIKFRLLHQLSERDRVLTGKSTLLLSALNMQNKYNGFFEVSLNEKGDPELLTMGPYTYFHSAQRVTGGMEFGAMMEPVKATSADVWMVKRERCDEAPNYFVTTDLKHFTAITDLQPQKRYNWLSSELLHWKQLDGTTGQGILYKPENFEPNKKYPLIIHYYRDLSNRLYEYPVPGFTRSGDINIPWFVSRGYLVFTPDIYFNGERSGEGVYNTVVSAAGYLSQMPFVDSSKMGIAGHSFAGGLTNYLVTHTHLFAAAFEGAGVSDYVSEGLEIGGAVRSGEGRGGHESAEGTLWQRPDLYVGPSPILHVDKVTTPLLMFHCEQDVAMPWEQAVELFMALRRLNKKAWLMEYDNGDHELVDDQDAADLTIRVTQFFDHYLKGTPAPVWMTRGIPACLKGIESGLEVDTSDVGP